MNTYITMFSAETYRQRRRKLKQNVGSGLILFPGNTDVPMNYPSNTYHWRQDSNFLYFFGLDYQNMAAIIDIDEGKEYLFADDVSLDDIIWMGPQITREEKASLCGVENHHPFQMLKDTLFHAMLSGRVVHFLPPYRAESKILLESLTGIKPSEQKSRASVELIKAVVSLRSIKEPQEIAEIEKAISIGAIMHTTAMKMARPGIYEREIAGALEGIALSHGGMLSFPAIVTKRGETLHNHYHGNKLEQNDLLLVDTGAESPMHYASDHTRTTPVGGKFSPRQKDIYLAVLDALTSSIEKIKPGTTNLSVHLYAAEILAERLKDIGLMKGDIPSAVEQGAHALFMPHGLGHMMGLDVHDMEDLGEDYVGYDHEVERSKLFGTAFLRLGRRYQPGFVLTVEPGCYFIPSLIDQWQGEGKFREYINYEKLAAYRNFGGIRIEDDVLVTNDSHRILGQPIARSVEEVESLAGSAHE